MIESAENNRYVILADVVESREIADRGAFRERLTHALAAANREYRSAIAAPFELIKGVDEFGGVLDHIAPSYELLQGILNDVHPVRIRVAITSGGIDVGRVEDGIATLDGPAFHRADSVLESLDATNLYAGVHTGADVDGLVASTINLLLMAREGRTDRQIEMMQAYERHGTQTAAAEELGVPQQAVSQALNRADYYRTKAIREQLMEALETCYD